MGGGLGVFSCSVIQLFSCSVIQLFSCSVVQLAVSRIAHGQWLAAPKVAKLLPFVKASHRPWAIGHSLTVVQFAVGGFLELHG